MKTLRRHDSATLEFKKIIVYFLSAFTIASSIACQQRTDSSAPAAILPTDPALQAKVIGHWQMVGGKSKNQKIPQLGNSEQKTQYSISKDKFTVLSYDGSFLSTITTDYRFEKLKLIPTQPSTQVTVYGFTILSFETDKMWIKPSGQTEPQDIEIELQRVSESELLTKIIAPKTLKISYHLKNENIVDDDSFSMTLNKSAGSSTDGDELLTCHIDKNNNLVISASKPKYSEGSFSWDSSTPQIFSSFLLPGSIEDGRNITMENVKTTIFGRTKTGISIASSESTVCSSQIQRLGKILQVNMKCKNTQIVQADRTQSPADFEIFGNCPNRF